MKITKAELMQMLENVSDSASLDFFSSSASYAKAVGGVQMVGQPSGGHNVGVFMAVSA